MWKNQFRVGGGWHRTRVSKTCGGGGASRLGGQARGDAVGAGGACKALRCAGAGQQAGRRVDGAVSGAHGGRRRQVVAAAAGLGGSLRERCVGRRWEGRSEGARDAGRGCMCRLEGPGSRCTRGPKLAHQAVGGAVGAHAIGGGAAASPVGAGQAHAGARLQRKARVLVDDAIGSARRVDHGAAPAERGGGGERAAGRQ